MALLEVSGLRKVFGGLVAVNGLDFGVESGELLSIIGPNGAGKTTLFNLLTGAYVPTAGKIVFDSKVITGWKPYQVARSGMVRTFQHTTVFGKETVLDNVVIGQCLRLRTGIWGAILRSPAARREEALVRAAAREILAFVGLSDRERKLAGALTEEAQKRLSIACALASKPKLVLLDEPTGGVNVGEIDGLIELVKRIRERGVTVCLIEHKMRMVMNMSDRVIVLNQGEKIAEGTPGEVANDKAVIRAYLGERSAA